MTWRRRSGGLRVPKPATIDTAAACYSAAILKPHGYSLNKRLQYYRRIFRAYCNPGKSQLAFWHEKPQINPRATTHSLGEYYMGFEKKAHYTCPSDESGVPMLDYRGTIGLQYNPISIAQWGLGNYNLWRRTAQQDYRERFVMASNWLTDHLEQNPSGKWVWNHYFDWDYRETLNAPWYSGLAQGQGISLLVRAHAETARSEYLKAAQRAFETFLVPVANGGVSFTDRDGDLWFEEYIVSPPTHILNGFIWAVWGVHDYYLATKEECAKILFQAAVKTLLNNLNRYDWGFWSLYEQSGTRLKMVSSLFYHQLHIVQLRIMHALTSEAKFAEVANRWESYGRSRVKRTWALCYKTAFKLAYY
jgi:heparosan-N-sulfate-glucuronate 5-epimerase